MKPRWILIADAHPALMEAYIVSGGGEFMRPWSEAVYGIPHEQVIGGSGRTKYEVRNGTPVLVRLPKVNFIDDKVGKPVGIQEYIGRRPIAAFDNSDGDKEMLEWATVGRTPSLGLIFHHTDDRLEALVGAVEESKQADSQLLRNDPPAILMSRVPALLVYIEGAPVFRPMKQTFLERVIRISTRSGAALVGHPHVGRIQRLDQQPVGKPGRHVLQLAHGDRRRRASAASRLAPAGASRRLNAAPSETPAREARSRAIAARCTTCGPGAAPPSAAYTATTVASSGSGTTSTRPTTATSTAVPRADGSRGREAAGVPGRGRPGWSASRPRDGRETGEPEPSARHGKGGNLAAGSVVARYVWRIDGKPSWRHVP